MNNSFIGIKICDGIKIKIYVVILFIVINKSYYVIILILSFVNIFEKIILEIIRCFFLIFSVI